MLGSASKPANSKSVSREMPAPVSSVNGARSSTRATTIALMPSSLRPLPARTRPW